MEKKDIDQLLENIQKSTPEKDFQSIEEFKKKFFEKVDALPEQNSVPRRRRWVLWGFALSSAACFLIVGMGILGNHITMMFNSLGAGSSACLAPAMLESRSSASLHSSASAARANASDRYVSACHGTARRVSFTRHRFVKERIPVPRQQTVFNTEEYKSVTENVFLRSSENPLSTFGADVDTASYNNVRGMINRNQLPPRDAVRIEEFINAFRYNYPAPAKGEKFGVTFESAPAPWNKDHKLLLIGVQAKEYSRAELPPANYVLLVDNSGSMYGEMPIVIEALSCMIDQMRPCDRLSLVTYSGNVRVLLDGISGKNKDVAKAAVRKLTAGGATNGSGGIREAYALGRKHFIKKGNNRIILVTDGDFNVGVSSESELVEMVEKERSSLIYLSAFGVGSGNYKDNKLKMLANKGNGNYFYLDSLREARTAAKKCFTGSMFTLARDVKFQIEFNPAQVKGYRLLGYELRKLAARDFNDDTKDSGEIGVGHQVTALYEVIPATSTSKALGSVDALKYQSRVSKDSQEILTCKLRYQDPASHTPSQLRVYTLKSYPDSGNNFLWASAVAEFAMLLKNSPDKGNASFDAVLKRAKRAMDSDEDGKRAEFITLVHKAKDLKENPQDVSPAPRAPSSAW